MSQPPSKSSLPFPLGDGVPDTQPRERFWPYAELAEEPSPEELAALDPDLHAALFGVIWIFAQITGAKKQYGQSPLKR